MSLQPATPNDYTVPVSDNDWTQMLQSNREAQELLSNAIAHHQEHYEDPTKRISHNHLHHKSDHYNQDTSTNGENGSEGDSGSDETSTPGDGKPAPKKAGRKPLTTEPTTKRKAQNRAAQRAFRERKEKYVKSLEDRIKELEELNPGKVDSKLAEENLNLKVLVQKLETENYFLKEQSFTFDFPISQPGLYNVPKAQRDDTPAQNMAKTLPPSTQATKATTAQVEVPKMVPEVKLPTPTTSERQWTPPSSGGDSVPNSPLNHDLPTPDQDTMSQMSSSDNAGVVPRFRHSTPEEMALFSTLLDGTGNTYTGVHRPLGTNNTNNNHTGFTDINALMGLHNTNNTHNNNSNNNNNSPLSANIHSPVNNSMFGVNSNNNNFANHSPATSLALFSDNSPSPTMDELVNTPLFHTDKAGMVHFTPPVVPMSTPSLTLEQTQALFTDFRDPSDPRDFFTGYDDPVENTFQGGSIQDLLNDPLLDYTHAFPHAGIVSPPIIGSTAASVITTTSTTTAVAAPVGLPLKDDAECGENKHTLPPLLEGEQTIPCPQAWEQLAKHPNFDDADIDELCAELKSKAKCSGHGPVIPVSEVDKVMSRLNQY
ncbi:DNA-binding transcription factor yap1 [Mortierella sp. GBA35]|nr:DNA-binding transcription factor yap1 [Mortierella sp. AD031]KAF9099446.1 DNA-binding transcription factor yap1 [Mortierella sp. GBA35]KAG0219240.1 DNA-binding transcription factor yap1 [Mortierella sp. NVP41]